MKSPHLCALRLLPLTCTLRFHKIRPMFRRFCLMFIPLAIFTSTTALAAKPRIRAVTAFVKIDRANYKTQLADANKMLQAAKAEYVKAGYEVQTVRITTQPFPQYVDGLSHKDALAFLNELDKLAKDGGYNFNIGPATVSNDTSSFQLSGEFLAH